ncbi:dehydrogenase/reductase SDR family member 11-like [Palaemon carinicauda]|uniref:dehydrogenase/reductase SDR family member 11-like n=1 Tax=Palaemon carinicauda TaxID=392227 RepID=UPI0035B6A002
MEKWRGRVALVTGASAGIGAAICKELVAAGMLVIGAARGAERIEALSSELKDLPGKLVAVKCDVTKDDDVAKLFAFIKQEHKGVDVCINNAGISRNSTLLDGTTEEWREMSDINIVALCHCTKEAVKSMKERNVDDGHIIHISSICGHEVLNINQLHFYTATKYAVTALTEGLRQELRDVESNIRVSAVSPGLVKTEFFERMTKSESEEFYSKFPHITSEDVASSVLHVLAAPPHVQIHEIVVRPVKEKELQDMLKV